MSYLTSRPSNDALVYSRQQATRQLWDEYFGNFEFVVSDVVITEIARGDAEEAQRRLRMIANFTRLDMSPAADGLAQLLIDSGAVPQKSRSDAQHISIATVHSLDYLISWNFKHIVNETKRQHIDRICRTAGFYLQLFVHL